MDIRGFNSVLPFSFSFFSMQYLVYFAIQSCFLCYLRFLAFMSLSSSCQAFMSQSSLCPVPSLVTSLSQIVKSHIPYDALSIYRVTFCPSPRLPLKSPSTPHYEFPGFCSHSSPAHYSILCRTTFSAPHSLPCLKPYQQLVDRPLHPSS
jgi:hypothetical protein